LSDVIPLCSLHLILLYSDTFVPFVLRLESAVCLSLMHSDGGDWEAVLQWKPGILLVIPDGGSDMSIDAAYMTELVFSILLMESD